MRAVVMTATGGREVLEQIERPEPVAGPGASHKTGTDIRSHDCHPRRWPSLLLR